jgi:hypothetical protein
LKAATKSGNVDEVVEVVRQWISDHTAIANHQPRGMKTSEFLKKCQAAGCTYRPTSKGGSWVVLGPQNQSLRFSKSTTQMDGNVVKRYVQKLGLSAGVSGIHFDEFQQGIDPEQRLIRRFRALLKRLAHA